MCCDCMNALELYFAKYGHGTFIDVDDPFAKTKLENEK